MSEHARPVIQDLRLEEAWRSGYHRGRIDEAAAFDRTFLPGGGETADYWRGYHAALAARDRPGLRTVIRGAHTGCFLCADCAAVIDAARRPAAGRGGRVTLRDEIEQIIALRIAPTIPIKEQQKAWTLARWAANDILATLDAARPSGVDVERLAIAMSYAMQWAMAGTRTPGPQAIKTAQQVIREYDRLTAESREGEEGT